MTSPRTDNLEKPADLTSHPADEAPLKPREADVKVSRRPLPLGSWELDVLAGEFRGSESLFHAFGWNPPAAAIPLARVIDAIDFADRARIHATIEGTLRTLDPFDVEHRVVSSTGALRAVRSRGQVIVSPRGEPVRIVGTTLDITEAKLAQERLVKSEEKYRSLVHNIPDVMWTSSGDNTPVYISPNVEIVLGFTAEELCERGADLWRSRIHADDANGVWDAFHTLFNHGKPFNLEYRVRHKDGRWIWIHDRALRTYNKNNVQYADGLFEDISARKQTEAALRVSEERYRRFLERNAAGFTRRLTDGTLLQSNAAMVHLLGYGSLEDLKAHRVHEFYWDPRERDQIVALLRKQKFITGREVRLKRKDGTPVWVSLNLTMAEEEGREIIESTIVDISDCKRAEDRLRVSESHYRLLFDSNVAAIIRNTFDGRIVEVNRSAAHLLGYESPEDVKGLSMNDFYCDSQRLTELMLRLQTEGRLNAIEFELRRKDGRPIWVLSSVTLTKQGEGEALVEGSLIEITERKEAEDQIRKLWRAVEQSPAIVVMTDRAANIEYVNPRFTEVTGYSKEEAIGKNPRMLKSGLTPAETYRDLWRALLAGGEWRGELTNRKKNGALYWEAASISAVKNPQGEITHFIAVKEDVSERKRAEGELLFKTALLEAQSETTMDAILVVDEHGKVVSSNARFASTFGIPGELLESKDDRPLLEHVTDQMADPAGFLERVKYLYKHPHEQSNDEIRLRDGRTIDRYSSPLIDSSGRHWGRIWYFRDISDRKRAEAEQTERRQLAELVAATGVALSAAKTIGEGLQNCAEILVKKIDAAFARIWTVNEADKVLELRASAGIYTRLDSGHARVPLGTSQVGQIAQIGKPYLTNDVMGDTWGGDKQWARPEHMVSFAGYPLKIGASVLGVVAAFARKPLTEAVLQAFASVADSLAQFVERMQSEQSLADSEERFRQLAENIRKVFFLTTPDPPRVTYVSPAYDEIFGRPRQEVYDRIWAWFDAIHPRDRERAEAVFWQAMQGAVTDMEYRIVCPDGSVRWIRNRSFPVMDHEGQFYRVAGTAEDVTDRVWANTRLSILYQVTRALAGADTLAEATPKLLQAICEPLGWELGSLRGTDRKTGASYWIGGWHKPASRFGEFENAAKELTFSPGEGFCGGAWAAGHPIWLSDLKAGDFKYPQTAARFGIHAGVAVPVIAGGDVVSIMELFSTEPLSPNAEVLEVLKTVAGQIGPLIERQHAEEQAARAQEALRANEKMLRQAEESYRSLVSNIPDVAWTMDAGGHFAFISPNIENVSGYSVEDIRQQGAQLFFGSIHPDDAARVKEALASLFQDGQAYDVECRVRRKSGEWIWIRDRALTTYEREGTRYADGLLSDITERKRMEQELRQAQKLEAVGQLAAGVAHEINTPIQFVGDNTRFLQDAFRDLEKMFLSYGELSRAAAGKVDPAVLETVARAEQQADWDYLKTEVPKAFEQTQDGVNRVARIVRAMKEFSHVDRGGEQAAADLNKALESTLVVATNELKYVADVGSEFGEIPPVVCNVGDLNQVFLNLLINAAHAIGEVAKGTQEKGKIGVKTWREGEQVVVAVSDTGSGIPESIRERIFEPFFTTKEVGKGTGQGLALAWSAVVDRHGGSLTFETEVGKGSTFFIRVPIQGASPARPGQNAGAAARSSEFAGRAAH